MTTTNIKRTQTSESSSIVYQESTTLTFGATPASTAALPHFDVKFHFTKDAKFDTMPHFHVDKTEYLYVECGSVCLTADGVSRPIDASTGQVEIKPWTPHRWEVLGGEETVVLERTVPSDGLKEAFFRNFVCMINDYKGMPPPLQAFKVFADFDNYPIDAAGRLKYCRTAIVTVTKLVGAVAGLAGYRSMYKEYTPRELYERLQ